VTGVQCAASAIQQIVNNLDALLRPIAQSDYQALAFSGLPACIPKVIPDFPPLAQSMLIFMVDHDRWGKAMFGHADFSSDMLGAFHGYSSVGILICLLVIVGLIGFLLSVFRD